MTPPHKYSHLTHIQTQLEPPASYILALLASVATCWTQLARQEAHIAHLQKELTDAIRRDLDCQNLSRNPSEGH